MSPRAALLATLLLPALAAAADVPFEILEGPLPAKPPAWDLSKVAVTDRFTAPAFALYGLPTKYNSRGLPADRSAPFVVRGEQTLTVPAGEYRVLVRSRWGSRLFVDGQQVALLGFVKPQGADGHEPVPDLKTLPGLPGLRPGHREVVAPLTLDGRPHTFRWELQVATQGLKPDLGRSTVAIAPKDGTAFTVLGDAKLPFKMPEYVDYLLSQRDGLVAADAARRRAAGAGEAEYWAKRHDHARAVAAGREPVPVPAAVPTLPTQNAVDAFVNAGLAEKHVAPTGLVDDLAFFRRLSLDTVGVPPTPQETEAFLREPSATRRSAAVDRRLADPRWADHWVSYWQDVLAENPAILKPVLNNSGPFRVWIHSSLVDDWPLDRFVTELARMDGSSAAGGPAGFALAAENDVPMAAKGQILAKAFLAADLTCARCHDAPHKGYAQEQLFSLAALLDRKEIKLPKSSTVPRNPGGRQPAVRSALKVGQVIAPAWKLLDLSSAHLPAELMRNAKDPREQLAAILTAPETERFGQVMANRVWKRLIGVGIVEPVDDWKEAKPSHPELLTWLGRELTTHDYSVKHVARLVLNSHLYQREAVPLPSTERVAQQQFRGPARRRLTAEQMVDGLFAVAGKPFNVEELTFDSEGRAPAKNMVSLGVPTRAWQFCALANERDRPSLALPTASPFLDVLQAYGWRDSRGTSQTDRDDAPTPLQSLTMANGLVHLRIARLSDDGALTALCLEDQPLDRLVARLVERVLTRPPTPDEAARLHELLAPGYETRRTGAKALVVRPRNISPVSWSNHLVEKATRLKLAEEAAVRAGDPPSPRLAADWRERAEDAVWALVASPEFAFVP